MSRRRIAETAQELADLGKDCEVIKTQCATLKKQFGVLWQQLDEMAKNLNAAVKDGDAVAAPAEVGGEEDDASALAAPISGGALTTRCFVIRFIVTDLLSCQRRCGYS